MGDDELRRDRPSRRDVMAGAAASALTFSTPAFAQPETTATGFVFEDRSGTGIRRPGDRGIAGVMVSNGRDVMTHGVAMEAGSSRSPPATAYSSSSRRTGPRRSARVASRNSPTCITAEGTPQRLNLRHAGVAPTGAAACIHRFRTASARKKASV